MIRWPCWYREECVSHHLYTLWLTVVREALWRFPLLFQQPSVDARWWCLCRKWIQQCCCLLYESVVHYAESYSFHSFIHSLHAHQHYTCVVLHVFSSHIYMHAYTHVHILWQWLKLHPSYNISKIKFISLVKVKNWHLSHMHKIFLFLS